MKKFFVVALLAFGISVPALAAENGGSDSCGLGWMIAKQKTLLSTFTRTFTNYFLPPTFSMTSGTSGCDRHNIAMEDSQAVKYAQANYESLTIEMAEGQGETLAGFAQVLGCNDAAAFGRMTQANYAELVTQDGNATMLFENVKRKLVVTPVSGCGV